MAGDLNYGALFALPRTPREKARDAALARSVMTRDSEQWQPEYEKEPPLENVSPEDFIPNPKSLMAAGAKSVGLVGATNPRGALQWIKDTMPPQFFDRAKKAMEMAKATGNEHAVTQGYRNWVSPIAEGERYGVSPIYPQHSRYKFALPREVVARMHTHPVDTDFGITVAPSMPDLDQFILNSKGKPIRDMIVSPDKNTFIDYSRPEQLDFKGLDKLYFDLMKHTQGNMSGIEPIKPDVYFSALRKAAENRNSGTRLSYELGDEAPYADEVFSTLKKLGMKKGGLIPKDQKGVYGNPRADFETAKAALTGFLGGERPSVMTGDPETYDKAEITGLLSNLLPSKGMMGALGAIRKIKQYGPNGVVRYVDEPIENVVARVQRPNSIYHGQSLGSRWKEPDWNTHTAVHLTDEPKLAVQYSRSKHNTANPSGEVHVFQTPEGVKEFDIRSFKGDPSEFLDPSLAPSKEVYDTLMNEGIAKFIRGAEEPTNEWVVTQKGWPSLKREFKSGGLVHYCDCMKGK